MSLIFSDIDGTLYGPEHKIHPDVKPAIEEAKKVSVMFNIATGNGAFKAIKELANDLGAKYLINSNGAGIVDLVSSEYIHKNMLSQEQTNKALQLANELEVHANWWNDKNIYCNEFVSEDARELIKKAMASKGPEILVTDKVVDDMFKIEFYDYDTKKIDKLETKIKELGLTVARMKSIHIEVTKPGVSKAHAIEIICELHNSNVEDVMSIGDSANDETMLKLAGYSYAMANAPKEVKEWAKFHTTAYNQNGVGMAIMDYLHRTKKDR